MTRDIRRHGRRLVQAGGLLVITALAGLAPAMPSAHAAPPGDPTAGCIANDSFMNAPVGSLRETTTPAGAPSQLPIPEANKVAPGTVINVKLDWDSTDFTNANLDHAYNCVRTGNGNGQNGSLTNTFQVKLSQRQDGATNDGEILGMGFTIPNTMPGGTFVCSRGILTGASNVGLDVQKSQRVCFEVKSVPPKPTQVRAVAGDQQATVSWVDTSDGGEPLVSHTVVSTPGNITKVLPPSARSVVMTGLTNGTTYTFKVTATNTIGSSTSGPSNAVTPGHSDGYWEVATDGGIFSFGSATFHGSTGSIHLNQPIVGMTSTPDSKGYWFVAADGGIFAFGDAHFFGSTGSIPLNQPIVGMAPTPTGHGYWFVAKDGGVFSFGDAAFHGSMGGTHLNKPIVGMAATPSGNGYWLVASDGGIFSFGDAHFFGSTGSIPLNRPIVGMTTTPTGNGYRFVASDGGIFSFGDAHFFGSTGGQAITAPIVGIAATRSGNGYWFVGNDGNIYHFGDAPAKGSLLGTKLNRPIVGIAGT